MDKLFGLWFLLFLLVVADVCLSLRGGRVEVNAIIVGFGFWNAVALTFVSLGLFFVCCLFASRVKGLNWVSGLVMVLCVVARVWAVTSSL